MPAVIKSHSTWHTGHDGYLLQFNQRIGLPVKSGCLKHMIYAKQRVRIHLRNSDHGRGNHGRGYRVFLLTITGDTKKQHKQYAGKPFHNLLQI